ncbi:PREDICTED: uncharacterized protein LOC109188888 isoform X1 [Ipomoea nil]|uniref:uncharacterized protein LOC109188888 isoform X1 n=1 Tax=Ipomoea nil TaxID=35883 RepID=UPI0009016B47|nr:PREDICTED: uncharacterized protein LOC109188888 isoform X1 [Ipomoea nil]
MMIFSLSITLCREIEVILNHFWWTGKVARRLGIRWKAWKALCTKIKRWLGVYDLKGDEPGTQTWRLLTRPDSLVERVFKSRYYPNSDLMNAVGHNPLFIWRSIVEVNNAVKQWYRGSIGDERSTTIGKDMWLVMAEDPYVSTHLHESVREAPVSSLMNGVGTSWDRDCIIDVFNARDANCILNIPVPPKVRVFAWKLAMSYSLVLCP